MNRSPSTKGHRSSVLRPPQPHRNPHLHWAARLLLLASCLAAPVLPGCFRDVPLTDGAELLLDTPELTAGSTFELRFPQAIVPADAIGQPVRPSPLVLDPPVRGEFVWVSRRSGVFTPNQPLRLGTRYRVRLQDGLRDAQGQPIPARRLRELETPPFTVAEAFSGFWDTNDVPLLPRVSLGWNAAVNAEDVARHAEFRRAGHRIPARAEVLTRPDPNGGLPLFAGLPGLVGSRTWSETFHWVVALRSNTPSGTHAPTIPPLIASEGIPPGGPELGAGQVLLTPTEPLPAGPGWELVIDRGVASPEVPGGLRQRYTLPLGTVRPFEIQSLTAHNTVAHGRTINASFSKSIGSYAVTNDLRPWIQVEPAVEGLEVSAHHRHLEIRGAFQLGTNYAVRIRAGLPALDPVTLPAQVTTNLVFAPIEPSLWFPTFDSDQLAHGRRVFPIQGVNVGRFRLRAKRLDEHNLIHALRGYRRYLGQLGPAAPLDYAVVAGRTVFDGEIALEGEIDHPVHRDLRWDELLESSGQPGAVFLTADRVNHEIGVWSPEHFEPGPQALVQLTDLGLVWKQGPEGVVAWAFSHQDARAIPGATIRLVGPENEFLAEALTDDQGVARLEPATNAVWVMASRGRDLHAVDLDENQVSLWSFGLPEFGDMVGDETTGPPPRVFLYSDRSLYRAGEPIHLQALVRSWHDGHWVIPADAQVAVRLSDPRGDTVILTNLPLSTAGTFHFTANAPERPRGHYNFRVEVNGHQATHTVRVADFQAAPFEVDLGTAPAYGPENTVRVPIRARYLQGEAVPGARIRWWAHGESQPFAPEGWSGFQFCLESGALVPFGYSPDSFQLDGRETPARGTNAVVTLDFSGPSSAPQPLHTSFTAEVTDLNQYTVTRQANLVRHSSDFYLGFRWQEGTEAVLAPGLPLKFELRAVERTGEPHPAPVPVRVKLRRITWNTVRVESAGSIPDYRSEAEVSDLEELKLELVPELALSTNLLPVEARERRAAGVRASFGSVREPGPYLIECRAQDDAGREILTVVRVDVGGDANLAWNHQNGTQLELVADRPKYAAGDTALLLARAPFSGTAWVTVEREQVRRSFSVPVTGNAPVLRVPIEADDAPNVFVSVTLVRGHGESPRQHPMPEWRIGYLNLPVENPANHLHVDVAAQVTEVRPGATVTSRVRVTTAALPPGSAPQPSDARPTAPRPVAGAEVTFYAVDEGVLALAGDELPDPWTFFSQPRALRLRTGISLGRLVTENPALRNFSNKGALIGGGGEDHPWREDFRPCALWRSGLLTDTNGEVVVEFRAPDSLTRYRLVAVAAAGSEQFGSGQGALTVNKPLMLQPGVPDFAHLGDELRARAMVFNRSTQALQTRVTLRLDTNSAPASAAGPLNPLDPPAVLTQALELPPSSARPVEFVVSLHNSGTVVWRWSVEPSSGDSADTDRVVSRITVQESAPLERGIHTFQTDAAETNVLARFDPRLLENRRGARLGLRLSNSRLGELGECAGHLLHYPYGCVEQTSSSLLPWLLFSSSSGLIPEVDAGAPRFQAAIHEGVSRLFSMQTSSGGFGYWPGAREPLFWGSAYAALVLGVAREHGAEVPEEAFDRLLDYLGRNLRGTGTNSDVSERSAVCLALYALARVGRPEPSWYEVLGRERDRLALEDAALVALAQMHSGIPAHQVRPWLELPAVTNRNALGWFGSPARQNAIRLLAWHRVQPDHPQTTRLLGTLLESRRAGHWETTQGNAWALFALAGLSEPDSEAGPSRGEVSFGSERWSFELNRQVAASSRDFTLAPGSSLAPLLLGNPQQRRLFIQASLSARFAGDPASITAQRHGFVLERRLEKLDEDQRPGPLENLRVGDRLRVTLRIGVEKPAEWVALVDPLPATLQFVRLSRSEPSTAPGAPQTWYSDFQEVRGDSVRFFRDHLPSGAYELQYIARVRSAGNVLAPPARVEAMYEPQRYGHSAAQRLLSQPIL